MVGARPRTNTFVCTRVFFFLPLSPSQIEKRNARLSFIVYFLPHVSGFGMHIQGLEPSTLKNKLREVRVTRTRADSRNKIQLRAPVKKQPEYVCSLDGGKLQKPQDGSSRNRDEMFFA